MATVAGAPGVVIHVLHLPLDLALVLTSADLSPSDPYTAPISHDTAQLRAHARRREETGEREMIG